MKTVILAIAATLVAGTAFAQNISGSVSGSQAGASIVNNGKAGAASAIAPGGIAGANSCMFTLGVGGAQAGFGLSFGIPIMDQSCDVRMNALAIAQTVGSRAAAKEQLCQNRRMRKAFGDAGEPCAADVYRASAPASAFGSTRQIKAAGGSDPRLAVCLKRVKREGIDPRACHRAYGN